jgi:hypothetical protein
LEFPKVCKNESCPWSRLGYHFWQGKDECPRCGVKLVAINEHEKSPETQGKQVSNRDMQESFRRLIKVIERQWEE